MVLHSKSQHVVDIRFCLKIVHNLYNTKQAWCTIPTIPPQEIWLHPFANCPLHLYLYCALRPIIFASPILLHAQLVLTIHPPATALILMKIPLLPLELL